MGPKKYVPHMCYVGLCFFLFFSLINAQTMLAPVEDVFVVTFGGGEGCNAFLKYDISSIPDSSIIDSVFITPYVWSVGGSWDGDGNFWNVNDQTWTEADSAEELYNLPLSDSTYQPAGFGTGIGWTQSVDISNIFLADYNAEHQFCSIKIKDPDDMTNVPMPGSPSIDSDDTLAIGNIIFDEYMVCYPHEYPNAPPWLVVYHHPLGVRELPSARASSGLSIVPNPSRAAVKIILPQDIKALVQLAIFSANGKLVKMLSVPAFARSVVIWDATDDQGEKVPAGVYFCKLGRGQSSIVEKISIVK